jgi:hypothetical protein
VSICVNGDEFGVQRVETFTNPRGPIPKLGVKVK